MDERIATLYAESLSLVEEARLLLSPIARNDRHLARRLRAACHEVTSRVAWATRWAGSDVDSELGLLLTATREARECVCAAERAGYLQEQCGRVARFREVSTRMLALLPALERKTAPPA